MESRNAKFLEHDFASGSDLSFQREKPSTSSERSIVIESIPQVQMGIVQSINENPQTTVGNSIDQVVHEVSEMVGQPSRQHDSHENNELTLRKSTTVRRSAIPDGYIVYLQELDDDLGAENDSVTFSHSMNSKEFDLWFNAMNYMETNGAWDLVKLLNWGKDH